MAAKGKNGKSSPKKFQFNEVQEQLLVAYWSLWQYSNIERQKTWRVRWFKRRRLMRDIQWAYAMLKDLSIAVAKQVNVRLQVEPDPDGGKPTVKLTAAEGE